MRIRVKLEECREQFQARMCECREEFDSGFADLSAGYSGHADYYEGEYVVTPGVYYKQLPTKGKTMRENLTMRAIPYSETANTAGGSTVYIGG